MPRRDKKGRFVKAARRAKNRIVHRARRAGSRARGVARAARRKVRSISLLSLILPVKILADMLFGRPGLAGGMVNEWTIRTDVSTGRRILDTLAEGATIAVASVTGINFNLTRRAEGQDTSIDFGLAPLAIENAGIFLGTKVAKKLVVKTGVNRTLSRAWDWIGFSDFKVVL